MMRLMLCAQNLSHQSLVPDAVERASIITRCRSHFLKEIMGKKRRKSNRENNGENQTEKIKWKIPQKIITPKVDFNEFVQNSLCCDMGMIIFDLNGYGGC